MPGVDDGSGGRDEAVSLFRVAAAEGIEIVAATPHVLRPPWWNEDAGAKRRLVAELNGRQEGAPRVVSGFEDWPGSDLPELLERVDAGLLTTIAGSRAVLVDLPPTWGPPDAIAVLDEMLVAGFLPVIAHKEMNHVFVAEPGRLTQFVERGAVTQLSAASLLGEGGSSAKMAASSFLKAGLFEANPEALLAGRERPWPR